MKRIGRWVGLLLYGMVSADCQGQATLEVTVSNPSAYERPGEIVEVGWKQLENVIGVEEPGKLVVYDAKHNEIASQVILAVIDYPDEPVEYYMGSAWSLAGVKDAATWFGIIAPEKDKLDHPLQVLIGK